MNPLPRAVLIILVTSLTSFFSIAEERIAGGSLPAAQAKLSSATSDYAPHSLSLKTNLIYDAALIPNIELEWRINNRFSVAAEADAAWWSNNAKHKYYQLLYFGAEGRWWFKTRSPWHGHYAGIMAGGGKFDLENGKKGYSGEGALAGLTYGFMFPISSRLSFDAEIGLGYAYLKYKTYTPQDGHYIYLSTKKTSYFGPVKAKFSLAWRFGHLNKKK